jgi:hypothetical protein
MSSIEQVLAIMKRQRKDKDTVLRTCTDRKEVKRSIHFGRQFFLSHNLKNPANMDSAMPVSSSLVSYGSSRRNCVEIVIASLYQHLVSQSNWEVQFMSHCFA